MSKTKKGLCWGVILILLVLMHIYKIDEIPYGINVDEMGMGYDAWCLDATDGVTWQNAVAVIDNQYYMAEKMDRSDVAGVLGNDDLTECGFRFMIPNEVLGKGDVRIVFGNLKLRKCYIEEY
jgi:hypothetical protein